MGAGWSTPAWHKVGQDPIFATIAAAVGVGLVKSDGTTLLAAVAGTDYVAPDVAIAANKKLIVDSSNSLTTVALQISGDANTGVGQASGADTISLVAGGVEALRAGSAAITSLVNHQIASGKVAILDSAASLISVALQINGDPNTGVGQASGADTISLVAGGVEALRAGSAAVTSLLNHQIASGKVAIIDSSASLTSVALQISGDPNTGVGQASGADTISLIVSGVERIRAATARVSFFTDTSVDKTGSGVAEFKINTSAKGLSVNIDNTAGSATWNANPALSDIFHAVRSKMSAARFELTKGANVASAGTITLGAGGNVFDVTGVAAIDFITTTDWQSGSVVYLKFTGNATVNHNTGGVPANTAAVLLSGLANIVFAANTVLGLVFDGTSWIDLRKVA